MTWKEGSTRKNNYGSTVSFGETANIPTRRLVLGSSYRAIDVSTPEVMSWVVTISSRIINNTGAVLATEAAAVWGNGGATNTAVVSCNPGTIISVAADSLFVDVTSRLVSGLPGFTAEIEIASTVHRSFADSEPQFTAYLRNAPVIGLEAVIPVPPFAKGFYASGANPTAGIFTAARVVDMFGYGSLLGRVTGQTMQNVRDAGTFVRMPPDIESIRTLVAGLGGLDKIIFVLDI
jgi:hypothetical protein